ncbi:MAG TPA: mechanosensitive ion channel family protein [Candidatus Angelobacter sp.]
MRGCLYICFFVLFVALLPASSQNQAKKNSGHQPEKAQTTHAKEPEASDPLGRTTPHGTLVGFLHAAQSGRYEEASRYLQLSKSERAKTGKETARQLVALMDEAFVGRIGAVSDDPQGSHQPDVPHDHERIGVFRLDGSKADVDLVRVSDPVAGNIWLFSAQTLADLPELTGQLEGDQIERNLPRFLVQERVLGTPLWRWIAFLLLVPISLFLAWGIVGFLHAGRRMWLRWRRHPVLRDYYKSLAPPARLILTVAFHWTGIVLLGYPLLFRDVYRRFAALALAVGAIWLVFRLINRWAEESRLKALAGPGYRSAAIVLLGQRIFKVVVVIVVVLATLSLLGVDITTAVAGLGIGSIAIAFAAQKTLENLLGGISILSDQVIRVGETCQIGDTEGTVEDISLRSTRIRTQDRTALFVPNGQLANMNVENITRRDKSLFHTKIGLRQETTPQQLRSILKDMLALLKQHPKVDPETARVRFVGFGESSFDIQVHCHILTRELAEFLAVREALLLEIMDLVAAAGVGFAMPSRALYMTEESGPEQQRAAAGKSKVIGMPERS